MCLLPVRLTGLGISQLLYARSPGMLLALQ